MKHHLALAFALALTAAPALAQEFKAGDITIDKPWARATPKGAVVGRRLPHDPQQRRRTGQAHRRHGRFRHRRGP